MAPEQTTVQPTPQYLSTPLESAPLVAAGPSDSVLLHSQDFVPCQPPYFHQSARPLGSFARQRFPTGSGQPLSKNRPHRADSGFPFGRPVRQSPRPVSGPDRRPDRLNGLFVRIQGGCFAYAPRLNELVSLFSRTHAPRSVDTLSSSSHKGGVLTGVASTRQVNDTLLTQRSTAMYAFTRCAGLRLGLHARSPPSLTRSARDAGVIGSFCQDGTAYFQGRVLPWRASAGP